VRAEPVVVVRATSPVSGRSTLITRAPRTAAGRR
jgi:hypothetical protein